MTHPAAQYFIISCGTLCAYDMVTLKTHRALSVTLSVPILVCGI